MIRQRSKLLINPMQHRLELAFESDSEEEKPSKKARVESSISSESDEEPPSPTASEVPYIHTWCA